MSCVISPKPGRKTKTAPFRGSFWRSQPVETGYDSVMMCVCVLPCKRSTNYKNTSTRPLSFGMDLIDSGAKVQAPSGDVSILGRADTKVLEEVWGCAMSWGTKIAEMPFQLATKAWLPRLNGWH